MIQQKYPFRVAVMRVVPTSPQNPNGRHIQTFNAIDMPDAERILEKEQGKSGVLSVSVLVEIYSWTKTLKVIAS